MAVYWKSGAIKPTLNRTAEKDARGKRLAKSSEKNLLLIAADSLRRFYSAPYATFGTSIKMHSTFVVR